MTEKMLDETKRSFLQRVAREGIRVIGERKLPYGSQYLLESDRYELVKVNFYQSKKGLSFVISDQTTSISGPLNTICTELIMGSDIIKEWYVGTDESGKGDYFGPLAAAAFISDEKTDRILLEEGIRDSKKIADQEIRNYAEYLLTNYKDCCVICSLEPKVYNQLYSSYLVEGKRSDQILATAHGQIICAALQKRPELSLIITDQFADEEKIRASIAFYEGGKTNGGNEDAQIPKLKIVPHAEKYAAVAAASILARNEYLKWMEQASDQLGMILPKGCGNDVKHQAELLLDKVGRSALPEYAKIHFRTTNEIMKRYCR